MNVSNPEYSGLSSAVAPRSARWRPAVLIAFFALYCGLEIFSYTQKSATYDEPLHLTAGFAALTRRDYRMDPTHPPLVRMWAALPLLWIPDTRFDSAQVDPLTQIQTMVRQNSLAHDFLYHGGNADRVLNGARFMTVLLGALLGYLIFLWTEEWLGFPAAVLALVFYIVSPNLSAHAALVTTDIGVSCFFFGTIYFWWRTARAFTPLNVVGSVLFFTLSILTKFSALLLIPTGALLLGFAATRREALTWRRLALLAGLTAVVAWVAIWVIYGLRYEPSGTRGWLFDAHKVAGVQREVPVLASLLSWIDAHRLLPNAFTQGLVYCVSLSENAVAYLGGEISDSGWWYYFPLAILVKTPVAKLALVLTGVVVLAWRLRARQMVWDALCILVPPAIYLGYAMTTGINIGLRHVLPISAFMTVIAAVAGHEILLRIERRWLRFGTLVAAVGAWVVAFASVYPNTLTFFNVVAGGPGRGLEYLADSNLDWGQGLKQLKKWMDENGVPRINLAYFGIADPKYHGISCVLLPGVSDYLKERIGKPELPGYVVISQTLASGASLAPELRDFYEGFERLEPLAVIGDTLKVYHVDKWPEPEAPENDQELLNRAVLAEQFRSVGWLEYAIPRYEEYLRHRPDDIAVEAHLAAVLAKSGRPEAAQEAYRRAVGLARARPDFDRQLAARLIGRQQYQQAIEPALTVARMLPGHPLAADLLGVALAGSGRFAEARAQFELAVQLDPNNALFHQHLARAIVSMGQRPK